MTDMPEICKTRTAAGECLSGDAVGGAWSGPGYLVVEAVYLRTEEFCTHFTSSLLGLSGLPGPRV